MLTCWFEGIADRACLEDFEIGAMRFAGLLISVVNQLHAANITKFFNGVINFS
jgi:hypothetical protein